MLTSTLHILLHTQEKGLNTCIFLLGLMRSRAEYWCSFWLTPFEWVFANRNFYHFWHHDFTSLLLHLLYTLTWVTHFIFHNKIPVESSHVEQQSTFPRTLPLLTWGNLHNRWIPNWPQEKKEQKFDRFTACLFVAWLWVVKCYCWSDASSTAHKSVCWFPLAQ